MENNTFGYARVSSKDQNEERQVSAFLKMGVREENIYVDKQSGKANLYKFCFFCLLGATPTPGISAKADALCNGYTLSSSTFFS